MPATRLDIPPQRIEDFCRKWRVKEFAVFGSALREDFRPDSVDLVSKGGLRNPIRCREIHNTARMLHAA